MFNLNKKRNENGSVTTLNCEVLTNEDGVVVQFSQFEQGDNNKWHNPKVITDVFVERYSIDPRYAGMDLESFVQDCYEKGEDVKNSVENISIGRDYVTISLPTTRYVQSSPRGFIKDTIFPLIVKINNQDVSRDFFDFDLFDHRAVDKAYAALINGEIPVAKNAYTDFSGVQKLHEELVSSKENPMP